MHSCRGVTLQEAVPEESEPLDAVTPEGNALHTGYYCSDVQIQVKPRSMIRPTCRLRALK